MKENTQIPEQVEKAVQSGFYKAYQNNVENDWMLEYDLKGDDYTEVTVALASAAWERECKKWNLGQLNS